MRALDHDQARWFERINGFVAGSNLAEDYDLVCRLLREGARIAAVADGLYLYRWHGDDTSVRRRRELDAAYAAVRDRH